jgi:magnesium transporter
VTNAKSGSGASSTAASRLNTVWLFLTNMPELNWAIGYPFALLAMVLLSVALYAMFKRRKWL